MAQKRILIYSESFLPAIGGLENNSLLLCETLRSLHYQVTLLTPQYKASLQADFKVVESRSKVDYLLQVKKHDLVIVNGGIAFKIILPCLLLKKKYLVIYQMATLYQHLGNTFGVKFTNQFRFILAQRACLNIAVSKFSFEVLKNKFGVQKSALLLNPADPIFETLPPIDSPNLSLNPFICLMAGRLIEGKGVFLLVKAIEELSKEGYDLHVHFIGDGPAKETLQFLDKSLFTYHLPVNKQTLKAWFQKVHLTIIPSTHHIEGSPLVMAESLVAGTPVLVASQPAMASSIDHPPLIFERGDLKSLKERIKYLMHQEHYEVLKKYCNQIAAHYTYPHYIAALKSIIEWHVKTD